jgi:NAD(P)-dependent dehydrogenase (short-subunit alcohol dehydrogenase family)
VSVTQAAAVTGGASGIGLATVETFLAHGWSVVAADLNQVSGEKLLSDHAAEVAARRLVFARTDVSVEADVVAALDLAVSTFGSLDCVVNNAGVGGAFGPLVEIEVADWDYTFGVITRGTFLGMKHGVRRMQPHAGCSIVNVASVAGILGDAGPQAYSAAKAAVIHMGRVFSAEVAPVGIRVNTVCPGAINTPLHPVTSDDVFSAAQPLPEVGRAEHLADAIYFLASPQAAFITGECIAVDGGLAAAGPRIGTELGLNSRSLGLVGVNRGTTGEGATVRRSLDRASLEV